MAKTAAIKETIVDGIRSLAAKLGRPPTRREFESATGISEYQVIMSFPGWRDAIIAAGIEPSKPQRRLDSDTLLCEWAEIVRKCRQIPSVRQYRREGQHSFSLFQRYLGTWSSIPDKFREFAKDKQEWADVLALLPVVGTFAAGGNGARSTATVPPTHFLPHAHAKLDDRPTYGAPMDFRGLRHEPVNEQGVVFLFGMVARELGYMVEAVQTGFPDCEAKRQVAPGKWQRVRIEFEFESRNFRDHGHPVAGCDLIVCWRHNWDECPAALEVVELASVVKTLARSED